MANLPKNKKQQDMDFNILVDVIQKTDKHLAAQASKAINVSLTLRNWLIGYYIYEFEMRGQDRAEYGKSLFDSLALLLEKKKVSRCDARELRRYRRFYTLYPQIWDSVSPKLLDSAVFMQVPKNKKDTDLGLGESQIDRLKIKGDILLSNLSFTHFTKLLGVEDDIARAFYTAECIRGQWSVRELERQIGSLLFERSVLSHDKRKLQEITNLSAEKVSSKLVVRDPYIFEFLGLRAEDAMSEGQLEDQLLDKIEDFLLELGNGFCFEARQKRIIIDGEYYFCDLVFFHRILKCHILLELKFSKFCHNHISQLSTYVSWYKKNMMSEGDNPPIGILLCTDKGETLAEYALAGLDNQLFVSKYQLALPSKEEICNFVAHEARELNEESKKSDPVS